MGVSAGSGGATTRTAPAVRRAAAVLGEVAHEGGPLNVSAMARRLSMPKSSVSDVCAALAHEGLLRRDADGAFELGAHLCELARAFVGGLPLLDTFAIEAARMRELADHTLAIAALQQADVVLLDVRLGRRPLPLTPRPGARLPATSTPTGRLLLSQDRRTVVEAAEGVVEIACPVDAPVPVAICLQVPPSDAERHGTEHITAAMEQLAAGLGATA